MPPLLPSGCHMPVRGSIITDLNPSPGRSRGTRGSPPPTTQLLKYKVMQSRAPTASTITKRKKQLHKNTVKQLCRKHEVLAGQWLELNMDWLLCFLHKRWLLQLYYTRVLSCQLQQRVWGEQWQGGGCHITSQLPDQPNQYHGQPWQWIASEMYLATQSSTCFWKSSSLSVGKPGLVFFDISRGSG